MAIKFCPSCSKETTSTSSFCSHCGVKLDPAFNPRNSVNNSSETNQVGVTPAVSNVSANKKIIYFALFSFLITFFAAGFYVYFAMIGKEPNIEINEIPQVATDTARPSEPKESEQIKIEGVSEKAKSDIIANNPTTIIRKKVKSLLEGKRSFGVQFIYEGYGKAEITSIGEVMQIKGSQFSKDKTEYARIEGTLIPMTETEMIFNGIIEIFTKDCCGPIQKSGIFTFRKTGNRKYWRLKEFNDLCGQYTCAYYMDIFE